MIDLHSHSIYSDGSLSPKELSLLAFKNNIKAIALTDHDTIDGVSLLRHNAKKHNIEVINGIEFSALYKGFEIHILGYFIDIKNKSFLNFLDTLKITREKRNIELISRLNDMKIDISLEYVASLSSGNLITKAHFAKALVKKRYADSIKDTFRLYLGKNCKGYVKRDLIHVSDAINIIKKAGGISSIAHPTKYSLSPYEIENMSKDLKDMGIDCIECYYSSHTEKETKNLLYLCNSLNLLTTAGSDFHGDNRKEVQLGKIYLNAPVKYDILNNLKKYYQNK